MEKAIREVLTKRITDVCAEIPASSLDKLSIAKLVAVLWLLIGQYGSVGDYSTTFYALRELLSEEVLHRKPAETETTVQ